MTTTATKHVFTLKNSIDYHDNSIVSKTLLSSNNSSLTLFAYDTGQTIATHTAPVDAVVQCIEGELDITISGELFSLKEGEIILMPKHEPHALEAKTKAKMALYKI